MIIVTTVFLGLAFLASAVFLWAYAWDNSWYKSIVGRALVSLAGSLTLILGWGLLRALDIVPLLQWVRLFLYLVIFLALVNMGVSFLIERKRLRKKGL